MLISSLTIWTRHQVRHVGDRRTAMTDASGPHISPGYANVIRRRYRQLRRAGLHPTLARYIIDDLINAGWNAHHRACSGESST